MQEYNYNQKKYPEAIAEFQTAVKIDPTYMRYHAQLAISYKLSGRKEESNAENREAIRLAPLLIKHEPNNPDLYTFVAWRYSELGQQDKFINWYKKAL